VTKEAQGLLRSFLGRVVVAIAKEAQGRASAPEG